SKGETEIVERPGDDRVPGPVAASIYLDRGLVVRARFFVLAAVQKYVAEVVGRATHERVVFSEHSPTNGERPSIVGLGRVGVALGIEQDANIVLGERFERSFRIDPLSPVALLLGPDIARLMARESVALDIDQLGRSSGVDLIVVELERDPV